MTGGPILDNHLHLSPERGRGMGAVEDFVRAGGTHLIVVNLPSWHHGIDVERPADFRPVFETTLETVAAADDLLPGRAWAVLGVHPGLITRLVDDRGFEPEAAATLMRGGLEVASEFVSVGEALGLKSGRPHYPVEDDVWAASNAVMRHAFALGAECDCAVQLHTEASEEMETVAAWAREAGISPERVVKHYAAGALSGPVPSVMAERDRLERAAGRGEPFLMETDFLDDPDRPGAVLGPKTVPRRVAWLRDRGHRRAVETAHVETPRLVYGVDTQASLE